MKNKKGFTLVELMIVIGITLALGVIFTNTLVQTLRSQNKSRVVSQVKQNGQVVLDRLSREIRQAEKVICLGDNQDASDTDTLVDTLVIFKNGVYSRFRLISPYPISSSTANGYIKRSDFTADNFPADASYSILCTESLDRDTNSVSYLSDRDIKNGVSLDYDNSNPIFYLQSSPGFGDIVTVRFNAKSSVSAGTLYEDMVREGGIPFSTTIRVEGVKR